MKDLAAIQDEKYKLHYLDPTNETLKKEFDESNKLYKKKYSYHKQVLSAYKRWVGHQEKKGKKTEVEILQEGGLAFLKQGGGMSEDRKKDAKRKARFHRQFFQDKVFVGPKEIKKFWHRE